MSYIFRVVTALSVLINVILGGHIGQTFSARNWQWKKERRFNLVKYLDFFLGKNHCAEAWVYWKTRKW